MFLIPSGQIHIMSSEEDSGDESYCPSASSKIKPPRSDYAVDTSVLEVSRNVRVKCFTASKIKD